MITDRDGNTIDVDTALRHIVVALDLRFPDHNAIGDRLGRLLEELGELAEAIYLAERLPEMGYTAVTKELQDCLRAVGGIAHHHQLEMRLPDPPPERSPDAPVLLLLATHAAGVLAKTAHHAQGMGIKTQKYGPLDTDTLMAAVEGTLERIIMIADHYNLGDALRGSIEQTYRDYQRHGHLPVHEVPDAP